MVTVFTKEQNYSPLLEKTDNGVELSSGLSLNDHKEVSAEVLGLISDLIVLDSVALRELRRRLAQHVGPSWLVVFLHNDPSPVYKKLVVLLPRLRIAMIDCRVEDELCDQLYIVKYPTFALFKLGDIVELHYGGARLEEITDFARIASQAHTMQTLTSSNFPDIFQVCRQ